MFLLPFLFHLILVYGFTVRFQSVICCFKWSYWSYCSLPLLIYSLFGIGWGVVFPLFSKLNFKLLYLFLLRIEAKGTLRGVIVDQIYLKKTSVWWIKWQKCCSIRTLMDHIGRAFMVVHGACFNSSTSNNVYMFGGCFRTGDMPTKNTPEVTIDLLPWFFIILAPTRGLQFWWNLCLFGRSLGSCFSL